jgi:hypothetical protein
VVDHGGITFHMTLRVEIAAIASVCNLSIFEHTYAHFDSIDGNATVLQNSHANPGSIVASCEMMSLVLEAVEACASMDEDGT